MYLKVDLNSHELLKRTLTIMYATFLFDFAVIINK